MGGGVEQAEMWVLESTTHSVIILLFNKPNKWNNLHRSQYSL